MPTEELIIPTDASIKFEERDHSACGVGMIVNLPPFAGSKKAATHELVMDGLKVLADFDYRSGFNPATGESDGAGIRFYGLPTEFFNKKIRGKEFFSSTGEAVPGFSLQEGRFAVGQYFLSRDPMEEAQAKALIEEGANANGLMVVGWRDLNTVVDNRVLSDKAYEKKPAMWQAILIEAPAISAGHQAFTPYALENAVLKTSLNLSNQARENKVPLHIISQSSESIVYKGMVRPRQMSAFYLDLQDEDFTAHATAEHSRFATNTDPQWANAQPCSFFWLHNGELNSAPANAAEMSQELRDKDFKGVHPVKTLSDSMQFDADLLNQVVMKGIPLAEAFLRLMPPQCSEDYSDESNAMLKYFRKERTPYNGPAFAVASKDGYFMAKLDECGLRPSRWGIIEHADGTRQFHAASDDYLVAPPGGRILKKGNLEPGGMIMVTPEGEILETSAILERISARYQHDAGVDHFQALYQATTLPLMMPDHSLKPATPPLVGNALQRVLYAAGWDEETITQVLRHMADRGMEPIAAMGDDTNQLYASGLPAHIAYFFHQLFAQVSAPPIDSIKERDRFSLDIYVGPIPGAIEGAQQIALKSPILGVDELSYLEDHPVIQSCVLDTSFVISEDGRELSSEARAQLLRDATKQLLIAAETAVLNGAGSLILSDRHTNSKRALIPDILAVAAVRKHLEEKNLIRRASIVADSYQISGPHHAAVLLAVGAKAVYARGANAKISELYDDSPGQKHANYRTAMEKCLLKTMGKMGITDVNNYINGKFIAALGLDLAPAPGEPIPIEHPTLASIFARIYSALRGFSFAHVANAILGRHYLAHDPLQDFTVLPRSGYYMPEKNGIKHGYGPEVVNAFTDWLKAEEIRSKVFQLDRILIGRGCPDYVSDRSIFAAEKGFLDPRKKDEGDPKGTYPLDYLETFRVSPAFQEMSDKIDRYKRKHPTSIKNHFSVKNLAPLDVRRVLGLYEDFDPLAIQSQASIRKRLFSGSMSQGALTVASLESPEKRGAHETLSAGMNAVHAMSASGEGGEAYHDLRNPLVSTRSKQIASGRFGISAMQLLLAEEVEIKVAQGAKPGEGGELPGLKVSIRFAAQRGGLPGTPFTSPPPHHDIYSIEDLEELIHDIKAVNPKAVVAVKLVASEGIGTIAVGVAKAGADVINIASNDGGTAAAQQSSIKHAGLPGELGLAEVDKYLRKAKLRDLVQLRTSGGLKTADDIIIAAILGADQFEFGTTAMLTLGCKMQRTCDKSCQPGVATDGHLFKGDQLNTERYFVNLAASVQDRLRALGVPDLHALRGHTDLLELLDPKVTELYDFSAILDRENLPPPLTVAELAVAKAERQSRFENPREDALVLEINRIFTENPLAQIEVPSLLLTTQDRSFGARIAGAFAKHLEEYPGAKIILNTSGIAGQSFGFVMPKGMEIHHCGAVQDGCAKSMTGGELVLCTPNVREDYRADKNTLVGNAMLYGARGGKAFVNGVAGHRFGILLKGAQVVVEGVGDLAFEYMTSGTAMILGKVGKGLCTGASGGIVFVYKEGKQPKPSESVRAATGDEQRVYGSAIYKMLAEHASKTNSVKAKEILSNFDVSQFHVWIPKALDDIKTLSDVFGIIKTYQLSEAPLTDGMQVWLEQKTLQLAGHAPKNEIEQLHALLSGLKKPLFSQEVHERLLRISHKQVRAEGACNDANVGEARRDTPKKRRLAPVRAATAEKKGKWSHEDDSGPLPMDVLSSDVAASSTAARGEDFGINIDLLEARASKASEVQLHPRKRRQVQERLAGLDGGLDELLLDALEHIKSYVSELTHEATGCSGCRAQSCAGGETVNTGCTLGKAINTINATLKQIGHINVDGKLTKAQWKTLRQAFEIQIQESPFIGYTGAACPAPCQDACTETIPNSGAPDPKRGGKPTGEHVHIKDIEYYLYHIGRSLGWFDHKKEWSPADVASIFGSDELKLRNYDHAMREFKAPFRKAEKRVVGKELIIVGSGPAAMQIAFDALRDGMSVRMYEKSDKAGGLLMDGIPAHKFDKKYLEEDFARLEEMGLELHLSSEVNFDAESGEYRVHGVGPIASSSNENQYVALCVGAGAPKILPAQVTAELHPDDQGKVIQAVDFLKAANDVADVLKKNPGITEAAREAFIKEKLGSMDPRGKKIVVVGGGDTAQDVIRWVARYFEDTEAEEKAKNRLNILVRGPQPVGRGVMDAYPAPSQAPTKEHALRTEEIEYVNGQTSHLVAPNKICSNASGNVSVYVTESEFKYYKEIQADPQSKQFFDEIPRENRPLDQEKTGIRQIDNVGMIICALGFQGKGSVPIVQAIEQANVKRVYIVGDAAATKPLIIVGAQSSAKDTYEGQIRPALCIPTRRISPLMSHSMFREPQEPIHTGQYAGAEQVEGQVQVA